MKHLQIFSANAGVWRFLLDEQLGPRVKLLAVSTQFC